MTREKYYGGYKVYVDDCGIWKYGIYVNVEYRSPGSSISREPVWERTFYITNDEYGRVLAFNRSEGNLINIAENIQYRKVPKENKVVFTVQTDKFLLMRKVIQ